MSIVIESTDFHQVDEATGQPMEVVPTFLDPDRVIPDLLTAARALEGKKAVSLIAAALTLAKAGEIVTEIERYRTNIDKMAEAVMPLHIDISQELSEFFLESGRIKEKVWEHRSEIQNVGPIMAIIMEECLELLKSVVSETHWDAVFQPIVTDLKFQISTLKTGLNVKVDYTEMRDGLQDAKVTFGNLTHLYGNIPMGEDLCEVIASNLTKVPDENGFIVNENYKIIKPAETFKAPQLTPWSPTHE